MLVSILTVLSDHHGVSEMRLEYVQTHGLAQHHYRKCPSSSAEKSCVSSTVRKQSGRFETSTSYGISQCGTTDFVRPPVRLFRIQSHLSGISEGPRPEGRTLMEQGPTQAPKIKGPNV